MALIERPCLLKSCITIIFSSLTTCSVPISVTVQGLILAEVCALLTEDYNFGICGEFYLEVTAST